MKQSKLYTNQTKVKLQRNLSIAMGVGKVAIIYDKSVKASKTSIEFEILEVDSISSKIKVTFNSGEHQLKFKFWY